ncbi:MAG: DUF433 domain-containing protein [Planctomycetes bacterium]|nr:DUF433 domain-containing protein [Planctomycetota bacterium]
MEEWITRSPGVLGGKPCIRGTRISVEFLLELLADGASKEQVLAAYPQLLAEHIEAALRFECVHDDDPS